MILSIFLIFHHLRYTIKRGKKINPVFIYCISDYRGGLIINRPVRRPSVSNKVKFSSSENSSFKIISTSWLLMFLAGKDHQRSIMTPNSKYQVIVRVHSGAYASKNDRCIKMRLIRLSIKKYINWIPKRKCSSRWCLCSYGKCRRNRKSCWSFLYNAASPTNLLLLVGCWRKDYVWHEPGCWGLSN